MVVLSPFQIVSQSISNLTTSIDKILTFMILK
jgi:hypothetical protein